VRVENLGQQAQISNWNATRQTASLETSSLSPTGKPFASLGLSCHPFGKSKGAFSSSLVSNNITKKKIGGHSSMASTFYILACAVLSFLT
jgi:hypothetical protein